MSRSDEFHGKREAQTAQQHLAEYWSPAGVNMMRQVS